MDRVIQHESLAFSRARSLAGPSKTVWVLADRIARELIGSGIARRDAAAATNATA